MSTAVDYHSLAHSKWDCKYHLVFIPKGRRRRLYGEIRPRLGRIFHELANQKDCKILEGHLMADHVHMILSIPPKYAISDIVSFLKGKTAIKLFQTQKQLTKQYWGRHIWARGYCVSSVGLNEQQIRKYVKWQQERDQRG